MLELAKRHRLEIERYLELNDLPKCLSFLSGSSYFLSEIPTFCESLQEELIETLFDLLDYPEEKEQTINYLRQQMEMYEENLSKIKKRYNNFMYRVSDMELLTKKGREQAGYDSQIMQQNLQYQDLKWELSSYLEGYHYDRNQYHQWLLHMLQG